MKLWQSRKLFILQHKILYILNTVSTRTEETAYNFLLNNVSNVILFINRYITFILRIYYLQTI